MKHKNKHTGTKLLLILLFIVLLIPLYWMFMGSFQDIFGVMVMPPKLIPTNLTLANYAYFMRPITLTWLKNTVIVTICTTIISVFLSSTAGYAFAFYQFKGKKILWSLLLVGLMIPRISLLISQYVILKDLKLSGSLLGIIVSTSFSPMGLYLARNYFETIPKSILESARIDGAHEFLILQKIVLPMSKPIVATLALFSSIGTLQDYIWQMLVLQKTENQTLLVGLMKLVRTTGGGDLNVNPVGRNFAVGTILLVPLLAIFLFANKYFTENLSGAMKE